MICYTYRKLKIKLAKDNNCNILLNSLYIGAHNEESKRNTKRLCAL